MLINGADKFVGAVFVSSRPHTKMNHYELDCIYETRNFVDK